MNLKNIRFVKRIEKNGVNYEWYVSTGPRLSDGQTYINYENGITVAKDYPLERLPKTVQKFVRSHKERFYDEEVVNGDTYTRYIYERKGRDED